jgi:hypothetical protein
MSLDVGTKLKADMFLVVQGLPGKEVTWRESIRHAARVRKSIQPKHHIHY